MFCLIVSAPYCQNHPELPADGVLLESMLPHVTGPTIDSGAARRYRASAVFRTPLYMRKLLIWSLLAFMPFTNVRLVCVERPVGASAASVADAQSDCDRFCLRRNAPVQGASVQGSSASTVDCVLLADGALLLVAGGVALVPALQTLPFEPATLPLERERQHFYRAPVLVHHSPPPRA